MKPKISVNFLSHIISYQLSGGGTTKGLTMSISVHTISEACNHIWNCWKFMLFTRKLASLYGGYHADIGYKTPPIQWLERQTRVFKECLNNMPILTLQRIDTYRLLENFFVVQPNTYHHSCSSCHICRFRSGRLWTCYHRRSMASACLYSAGIVHYFGTCNCRTMRHTASHKAAHLYSHPESQRSRVNKDIISCEQSWRQVIPC